MTEYLLLYQGGDPDWMTNATPAELQAVMEQWGAWFKELETSGNLRNPGAALKSDTATLRKRGADIVTDTTLPEVKELIGGFSVIQAESLDHATELAKGCPFLRNNPDGRVLVRRVMTAEEYTRGS